MFRAIVIFFLYSTLSQAASLTTIKVSLDWFLNPHHAPLIIGIEKGFFRENGLDVQLIPVSGSLEGCIQAAAGHIDFAITNQPQWLIQKSRGLDLRFVFCLVPEPLEVLISRFPIDQLKGKYIGHASSGCGFSCAVLKEVLGNQKIKLDEIELIYTRQALVMAFLSGQVDAITNAFRSYELEDIKNHDNAIHVYPIEELGIPSFASMILVSGPHVSGASIERFQKALKKSCHYIQSNSEDSWTCFKNYRPELDTPANQKIWPLVAVLFKNAGLGVSLGQEETLEKFLKKHELLSPGRF
ncbi:MAG: ABC transporter substrate-binding protein [Alphaproteobacteria bacterium]|nr:ABC transporter substrate-binding protein [Alphaproteobacteria bacterium]